MSQSMDWIDRKEQDWDVFFAEYRQWGNDAAHRMLTDDETERFVKLAFTRGWIMGLSDTLRGERSDV